MSAGNLAGTRSAAGSGITALNVARLRARWRFPGIFASTPVTDANTVYVQDLRNDVFALDRATGAVRWVQRLRARTRGPNGLAVDEGRVYGEAGSDMYALAASNGRELWRRRLARVREQLAAIPPVAWKGLLFTSTVSSAQPGHGEIYALNAATGVVRWRFATIETAGPVLIDAAGRLYAASSTFVLDARSGQLLWREHGGSPDDFGMTSILAPSGDAVFLAGVSGHVLAWNRETKQRLWDRDVGLRNTACRGVRSQMAYTDGRLFVPVVDLCTGGGSFIALDGVSGHTLWERRLPSPDSGCATVSNDVVFTSTSDGTLYAFATRDGRRLWRVRLRTNVGACPAIAGDTLLIGSRSPPALVAFELP